MVSLQPVGQHMMPVSQAQYSAELYASTPPGTPSSSHSSTNQCMASNEDTRPRLETLNAAHVQSSVSNTNTWHPAQQPVALPNTQHQPQPTDFSQNYARMPQMQLPVVSRSASDHVVQAAMQAVCRGPPVQPGTNMFIKQDGTGQLTAADFKTMNMKREDLGLDMDGSHRLTPNSSDDQKSDIAERAVNGRIPTKKSVPPHLKKGKFPCDECELMCKTENQLYQHKREHTGEKPYQCEKCGRRFTRCDHLTRHIKNVHKEDADRLLPLNVAGLRRRVREAQKEAAAARATPSPNNDIKHKEHNLQMDTEQSMAYAPNNQVISLSRQDTVPMFQCIQDVTSGFEHEPMFTPATQVPSVCLPLPTINTNTHNGDTNQWTNELNTTHNAFVAGPSHTQGHRACTPGSGVQMNVNCGVMNGRITPQRPPSVSAVSRCLTPNTDTVTKDGRVRGLKKDGTLRKKPGRKPKIPIELSLSEESTCSTTTAGTIHNGTGTGVQSSGQVPMLHSNATVPTNQSTSIVNQSSVSSENLVIADLSNEHFHSMPPAQQNNHVGSPRFGFGMNQGRLDDGLRTGNGGFAFATNQTSFAPPNVPLNMNGLGMMGGWSAMTPQERMYRPSNEQLMQHKQPFLAEHHQQQQFAPPVPYYQPMIVNGQGNAQCSLATNMPMSMSNQQAPNMHTSATTHLPAQQHQHQPASTKHSVVAALLQHRHPAPGYLQSVVNTPNTYNPLVPPPSVTMAQAQQLHRANQNNNNNNNNSTIVAPAVPKVVKNEKNTAKVVKTEKKTANPRARKVPKVENSDVGVVKTGQSQNDGSYTVVRMQSLVSPTNIDLFQL